MEAGPIAADGDLSEGLTADVLVVGAGPAGAAAAIEAATLGLKVILAEREGFPRHRPGEALHPGVNSLLGELGVLDKIDAVTGARFAGVEIAWNGHDRFEAFGEDETGPWLGRQVDRAAFDAMLLDRARAMGVTVLQPCAVRAPIVQAGRVVGAETDQGPIACRLLVDATGAARLLTRKLALPEWAASPPLVVRYGYATGELPVRDEAPLLTADRTGWTWIAKVAAGRFQWVRLDLDGTRRIADWQPGALAALPPDGASRGAEVAWRLTEACAGPGWFLAGDAAAQLDPTSSHGVLKALLSGVMAARTAAAFLSRGGPEAEGAAAYRAWLAGWFDNDVAELAKAYAAIGAEGFGETREAASAI